MKKIIVIVLIVAAAVLGVFYYNIQSAKKAAVGAVDACNAAVQEYNEKIEPYNEAAAQTATENEKLQKLLDSAQADIEKGEKAYEEDTLEDLERAVKKASEKIVEVPAQIDALELVDYQDSFDKKELEASKQAAEEAEAAAREAMKEIPEVPAVPDYSKEIKSVEKALKAYRDSVQKLANVTAPPDGFVAERLRTVRTVTETAAVSKGHDPNQLLGKEDGYIGCVYFRDERIDSGTLPVEVFYREGLLQEEESADGESSEEEPAEEESLEEESPDGESSEEESTEEETAKEESAGDSSTGEGTAEDASPEETPGSGLTSEAAAAAGTASSQSEAASAGAAAADREADVSPEALAVIAAGTAGGGAVEVYQTKKEAKERDEYLAFFAGSVMDPGAHTVEGTCVIRASRYLEETEQLELMEEIRQALLKVE